MNQIFWFILGMIIGGAGVWFVLRDNFGHITDKQRKERRAKRYTPREREEIAKMSGEFVKNLNDNVASGLIEKQAEEKKRNKEAILTLLETQGRLTNSHIEQMLDISDATATRYLDELEKEGKVKQVGKSGPAVFYEKV